MNRKPHIGFHEPFIHFPYRLRLFRRHRAGDGLAAGAAIRAQPGRSATGPPLGCSKPGGKCWTSLCSSRKADPCPRRKRRWMPPSWTCRSDSSAATAPVLDDIRATADRLAGEVDRVVVLGIGGSYMGARALFEACCHPYHNELARAGPQRPAADLLRGQQRRQRCRGRIARRAGRRRPLGDRGRQQERRHAGDGRRLPHLPRRLEEVVRRRR